MKKICDSMKEFIQGEDNVVSAFYEGLHGGEIQQ